MDQKVSKHNRGNAQYTKYKTQRRIAQNTIYLHICFPMLRKKIACHILW